MAYVPTSRAAASHADVKTKVHRKLLQSLNSETLRLISKERLRGEIGQAVEKLLLQENIPMTLPERDRIIEEILDEVFGLGPLEPLMKDTSITDILVNNYTKVYVERRGMLQKAPIQFKDNKHLLHIIEKMVTAVGRRIDEANPIVAARLADGSRVTAAIPPITLDGPALSIRRFGGRVLTNDELLANGTLTPAMLQLLDGCVRARLNLVISGGSGSGKTTLLNAMSRFIPDTERIVTIEDIAELMLQQRHIVRLETRDASIEGQGAITPRDLLINALRMRPDRIIVGEARGPARYAPGHEHGPRRFHDHDACELAFGLLPPNSNHGLDGKRRINRTGYPPAGGFRYSSRGADVENAWRFAKSFEYR
jgi:pilus assembly protein CpaF